MQHSPLLQNRDGDLSQNTACLCQMSLWWGHNAGADSQINKSHPGPFGLSGIVEATTVAGPSPCDAPWVKCFYSTIIGFMIKECVETVGAAEWTDRSTEIWNMGHKRMVVAQAVKRSSFSLYNFLLVFVIFWVLFFALCSFESATFVQACVLSCSLEKHRRETQFITIHRSICVESIM